jgi:membrane protein implicated in regulation of membrane protease activity
MSNGQTSQSIRNFNTWFGAIFLAVGLVALGMGLLLFRLLDGDPDVGAGAWLALGIPTLVGTIFLVIGGYFFRHGLEKSQREAWLRQSGTLIEARITAVEPTSTRVNGRQLWHVRYTYEAHTGRVYSGESGYLEAREAQSYRPGQLVYVRYDPEQPTESGWVGRDQLA